MKGHVKSRLQHSSAGTCVLVACTSCSHTNRFHLPLAWVIGLQPAKLEELELNQNADETARSKESHQFRHETFAYTGKSPDGAYVLVEFP